MSFWLPTFQLKIGLYQHIAFLFLFQRKERNYLPSSKSLQNYAPSMNCLSFHLELLPAHQICPINLQTLLKWPLQATLP